MRFPNIINYIRCIKYLVDGLWFLQKGRYEEAISRISTSLNFAGRNQSALYECTKYLGIAYWHQKKIDQARDCLLKAEALSLVLPKKKYDSELLSYLGYFYHSEGETLKAKEYCRLAIRYYKHGSLTDIEYLKSRLLE